MRYVITDAYYPAFLQEHYRRTPGLSKLPYDAQLNSVLGRLFGTSDFYSANLRKQGHEAIDVISNCEPLQRQWARENAPELLRMKDWLLQVLAAQVRAASPDVLYVQDINWPPVAFYRELPGGIRLTIGQTAYALQPTFDYGAFDLILTALPHYLTLFRRSGLDCEPLAIAFEPRVLDYIDLKPGSPTYDATFVGGIGPAYPEGARVLEHVGRAVPLDTWGYGFDQLARTSALRARFHGSAFGLEMYQVLARSRVTLNRHGTIAGRFAVNMRLYESTGVGSCLVTDNRDNLSEQFVPDIEVVGYDSPEDCLERVRYLLDHEPVRAAIAAAGQRRTLRDHTYEQRLGQVSDYVDKRMRRGRPEPRQVFLVGPPATGSMASRTVTRVGQLILRLPRPLPRLAADILSATRRTAPSTTETGETDHRLIDRSMVSERHLLGWKDSRIPDRQWNLVERQLASMYLGSGAPALRVLAEAIRGTGEVDPVIAEIGCASGYHSEALAYLLRHKHRYIGVDYSAPLIHRARSEYPELPVLIGDAAHIPLRDASVDILLSGGVILTLLDYRSAIEESVRVARRWCIFHRTPVSRGPTAILAKEAYGVETVEMVFNEMELLELFAAAGLELAEQFSIERSQVPGRPGPITMKTYLFAKPSPNIG